SAGAAADDGVSDEVVVGAGVVGNVEGTSGRAQREVAGDVGGLTAGAVRGDIAAERECAGRASATGGGDDVTAGQVEGGDGLVLAIEVEQARLVDGDVGAVGDLVAGEQAEDVGVLPPVAVADGDVTTQRLGVGALVEEEGAGVNEGRAGGGIGLGARESQGAGADLLQRSGARDDVAKG